MPVDDFMNANAKDQPPKRPVREPNNAAWLDHGRVPRIQAYVVVPVVAAAPASMSNVVSQL